MRRVVVCLSLALVSACGLCWGNCFGTADGKAGAAGNVFQQNAGDLGEAFARCHAGGSGEIGSADLVTDVLEYGDATSNAREDGADI